MTNPLQGKLTGRWEIPTGTQVVLKITAQLSDDAYRKPGTVGVIVESPSRTDGLYTVQFADGRTSQLRYEDLDLRRQQVDSELAETSADLFPSIIYRCQVGSKAYGLATEESDDDWRGIYLPPARLHWSLYKLPEQIERKDGSADEVYWEFEKFARLALKGNPNVLETLWTPAVVLAEPLALELREIRAAFLSKHLYKTYSGYVLSQFRRMANAYQSKGSFKTKHAMHLVRLLYSGIHALRHEELLIDVSRHRQELSDIRQGRWTFDDVRRRALELDKEFQAAFDTTRLPEQPDYRQVDDFLIRARRSVVDD